MSHSVNDVYVLGHLVYQTDENWTVLATFTYDSMDVTVSVQMGSDPNSSPRYYYVYNGHGDVVALVDANGNSVASYAYDAFGQLTSFSENFGSGTTCTNPYRYDGKDGVRYDGETDFEHHVHRSSVKRIYLPTSLGVHAGQRNTFATPQKCCVVPIY